MILVANCLSSKELPSQGGASMGLHRRLFPIVDQAG